MTNINACTQIYIISYIYHKFFFLVFCYIVYIHYIYNRKYNTYIQCVYFFIEIVQDSFIISIIVNVNY